MIPHILANSGHLTLMCILRSPVLMYHNKWFYIGKVVKIHAGFILCLKVAKGAQPNTAVHKLN